MDIETKKIKEKFYNDIIYIVTTIEQNHPCPYFKGNKEKIINMIIDFKTNDNINTIPQFLYFINLILKEFYDPHTMLNMPYKEIPLKFRIIDNKVFIIEANNKYKALIGKEVSSINNVDITTIINELKDIVPYTMPNWTNVEAERNLSNLRFLEILPSINNEKNDGTFSFEIEGTTISFNVNQSFDYSGLITPYYNYEIDYDNNVIIIKYRKCQGNIEEVKKFALHIFRLAEENNIDNFIMDLRGNTGGNSNITWPLIKILENKNIVTLVDKAVFSSGSLALYDLKQLNSKVIGSHIGTTWNNFGDCKKFQTPNLGLELFVSQKYFFLDNNGELTYEIGAEQFDAFFSDPENQKYLNPQVFEPDIYIDYQLDDIFGKNMEQIAMQEIKKQRKKL